MSTSKQVQQSVSQHKLEQAAGKIDQAKDVIMKEIQNLVDMEKSLTATENAGPTGKKIAETKKALEEKLAELNSLAIKMMDSVDDTITIFETLTGLYDELDAEKLAMMTVSPPKPPSLKTALVQKTIQPPLPSNLEAMVDKMICMGPKCYTCPWFILKKIALEDQINALNAYLTLSPKLATDILKKDAKEAKNLMNCHNENILAEETAAEAHARVLLVKEKLRLFSQVVEPHKHEKVGTPVFDEIRLQHIVDNYRKVDRDQRAVHFFVKARLRFHEKNRTAVEQKALYAAIDEMAAEEEVVAEIARYFLAHSNKKYSIFLAEQEFYSQMSDRLNNIMFAQFVQFCEILQNAGASGQVSDDLREKVSWMQDVANTVPYRRNNLSYIDGTFLKNRTDHHFKIVNEFDKSAKSDTTVTTATSDKKDTSFSAAASDKAGTSGATTTSDIPTTSDTPATSDTTVTTVKTTPSHRLILYYEFLWKNQCNSPYFEQQFTMLEDCSKKLPKEQFEMLEIQFFQCLFPWHFLTMAFI